MANLHDNYSNYDAYANLKPFQKQETKPEIERSLTGITLRRTSSRANPPQRRFQGDFQGLLPKAIRMTLIMEISFR
jgi:hypothetical protein